MDKAILKAFWGCGDNQIIEFALLRAHLNRYERETLRLLLDECLTQEDAAEEMQISVRHLQEHWYSAMRKMLGIPWVAAFGKELLKGD